MPSFDALLTFTLIVSLIVLSPGPSLFLLLRTTPSFGKRFAFANIIGNGGAILSHAALSVIGVGAIIATSATAFAALKTIGAAYLIWLGIKSFRAAWQPQKAQDEPLHAQPASFWAGVSEGYLTNILNPKPAIFYLAIFPQFIVVDGWPLIVQGMSLGLIHCLVSLIWYSIVVLGIDTIATWLRRPRTWRIVQSVSGLVLIALSVRLLLTRQAT